MAKKWPRGEKMIPLFPFIIPLIGSIYKTRRQELLQMEQWKREDNAAERRVLDLKKAGLSPTLAAGNAAAASQQAAQHPFGKAGEMLEMMLATQREMMNVQQIGASTMKTNAETANLIRNLDEAKRRGSPVGAQPTWIESLIKGFERQIAPNIDNNLKNYTRKASKKEIQMSKYGGNVWQWLWKKQSPGDFLKDVRNFPEHVLRGQKLY